MRRTIDLPRQILLVIAGAALLVAAAWPVPVSAGAAATLRIQGPAMARIGHPIQLRISVNDSVDLAGYETALLFDTDAAHFGGAIQRHNDLKRLGRGVMPLQQEISGGVAIGLYSCPARSCVSRARPQGGVGRRSEIRLATVDITPDRPGTLEVRLGGARFVDSAGRDVAVSGAGGVMSIRVGGVPEPFHRAPQLPWSPDAGVEPAAIDQADLTGDGIVTHSDAMAVAYAWTMARLDGDPCGRIDRTADLDGNGCVDVADLQGLAARYSHPNAIADWAPRDRSAAPPPRSSAPVLPRATQPTSGVTFVVDDTGDAADSDRGNGICRTSGGACTLRAAVEEANRTQGGATVAFAITGGGATKTITLGSRLPVINNESGPVFIDGYTQSGATPNTHALASNAVIRIQIAGPGESNRVPAFYITSSDNTIRGLALYRSWRDIFIDGPGASDNAIVGNFIGTNAAGTYNTPNWIRSANGALVLDNGAHHNQIGRPVLADRNVVSGGPASGIYHTHDAHHNTTQNNIVGLNPAGTARVPNKLEGVDFNFGASHNLVGGTGPLEHNVQSGNTRTGGEASHGTNTIGNRFVGNYVGTDLTGTRVLAHTPNQHYGIHVEDGAGSTEVIDNVICGNTSSGIRIDGVGTVDTLVARNRIGITLDGTAAGNATSGIRVNFETVRGTIIENVIANNPRGIEIRDVENDRFTISRNSIYGNTGASGLGIDLAPIPGVNPNDAGDGDTGANQQLNFPVLGTATPSVVTGTACAACTVEIFESDRGAGEYGSGRTFVGSATAAANGTFNASVSGIDPGDFVTATTTDAQGNTSEFALNVPVGTAGVFAADTFTRTRTDSWGSAETGGGYTLSGAAADFDVNGTAGLIDLPVGTANRAAHLQGVSARDVDVTLRLRTDSLPTGSNLFAYTSMRRMAGNTEYRAKVQIAPSGQVSMQATRVASGSETGIGSQLAVPGLVVGPGTWIRVRVRLTGVSPTTFQMKTWADGAAEPSAFQISVTDSTAALQAPGAVGLRAYRGSQVTSGPITVRFDDYQVAVP